MKLRYLILTVLPLLLCHCASTSMGAQPDGKPGDKPVEKPGAVDASKIKNEALRDAFAKGVEDGRKDYAKGLSPSYGRHVGTFDDKTEDAYCVGYQEGYTKAGR